MSESKWSILHVTPVVGWRVVISFDDEDEEGNAFKNVAVVDAIALVTYVGGYHELSFVMPHEVHVMTAREWSSIADTPVSVVRVMGPSDSVDLDELLTFKRIVNGVRNH